MRYLTNTLLTNTTSQIAAKGVNVVLGFLTVGLLTRYLGVGGYGTYTLVFTYLAFFGIISDFGLQLGLVRDFSNSKQLDQQLKTAYFSLKLILTVLSTLLAIGFLLLFPYTQNVKTAIIVGAIAVFAGQLNAYGASVLQSQLKLNIVALLEVVNRVATVIAILIFIYLRLNIYLIISSVLLGNLISFGIYLYLSPTYYQIGFRSVLGLMQKIMKSSFLIGITSVLAVLYFKVDTLMLSVMKSEVDVGIYSLAYKILENIIVLWGFYMASVYPLISNYIYFKKSKEFKDIIIKSIIILLVGSFLLIIITLIFAPSIINYLAGNSFSNSIYPLRIIIFVLPLLFVNNLFYFILLASKQVKAIILALLMSLAINLLLNYVYIPIYSFIATSYITIITEAFLFLTYAYLYNKIVRSRLTI